MGRRGMGRRGWGGGRMGWGGGSAGRKQGVWNGRMKYEMERRVLHEEGMWGGRANRILTAVHRHTHNSAHTL